MRSMILMRPGAVMRAALFAILVGGCGSNPPVEGHADAADTHGDQDTGYVENTAAATIGVDATNTADTADTADTAEATDIVVEKFCPVAVIHIKEGEEVIPQTWLHLSAKGSKVGKGATIKGYTWTVKQPAGANQVFFPGPTVADPTFIADAPGEYEFCLEITDSVGRTSCNPACVTVLVLPEEAIHIELLWKTPADPDETDTGPGAGTDLDLHLAHPLASGPDNDCDGQQDPWFNVPYDTFWFNHHPKWRDVAGATGSVGPSMDLNDTDGGGPENINFDEPEGTTAKPMQYMVGVHYPDDHGFKQSQATVNIYIMGVLALQVLNIETDGLSADFTGTLIEATQPVAVFAGHEAAQAPVTNKCDSALGKCVYQGWTCSSDADCPTTCCGDHIEEQLPPVEIWGTEFAATRTAPRGQAKDVWRIVAADAGTVVTTIPQQTPPVTLGAGQLHEFESASDFNIKSDKPILVAQITAGRSAPAPNNDVCTAGQTCAKSIDDKGAALMCIANPDCPNLSQPGDASIGDPAMVIVPPITRYMQTHRFAMPGGWTQAWLNIVAPVGAKVALDGVAVPTLNFQAFGVYQHGVARLQVKSGSHVVSADKPVGIVVYGFAEQAAFAHSGTWQIK